MKRYREKSKRKTIICESTDRFLGETEQGGCSTAFCRQEPPEIWEHTEQNGVFWEVSGRQEEKGRASGMSLEIGIDGVGTAQKETGNGWNHENHGRQHGIRDLHAGRKER